MSKFTPLSDTLYDYLWQSIDREADVLRKLREETAAQPLAIMQISPDQGQFMALLAQLMGARRTIEVGTFTGYSALATALAMPEDSYTVCCDVSEEWTDIARRYWQKAGVANKIELRLQPALQTLDELLAADGAGTFDFVFIDADKEGYRDYYERSLQLLRPGGLIAIDNVLWFGAVADPEKTDADTLALRELNAFVQADERVDLAMVPIGDGLTLARKR